MKRTFLTLILTLLLVICLMLSGCDGILKPRETESDTESQTEEDSETVGSCNSEHAWNNGKKYAVPGGTDTVTVYTCTFCGENKTEGYSFDGKRHRISIKEGASLLLYGFEMPQRAVSGEIVEIHTHVLMDADINILVNGLSAVKTHSDYDGWRYSFVMPNDDVELSISTTDGFDIPNVTYLFCFENWLYELDASQITEIREQHDYIGVAPGTLSNIYYTADSFEISRLLYEWQSAIMTFEYDDVTQIPGGSSITLTFTLSDGESYSFTVTNGIYSVVYLTPFRLVSLPLMRESAYTRSALSFITLNDTFKLYDTEGLVGEFSGLSDYEFVPYDGPITLQIPTTYIECEFGTLRLYSPTLFSFTDLRGEQHYYEIVGQNNFSFAFE